MCQVLDCFVGQRIIKVETQSDKSYDPDRVSRIYFYCESGDVYEMYHNQDCCEDVYLEEGKEDLGKLLGEEILTAEVSTNCDGLNGIHYEKELWTYYKFTTSKGYIDLRWFGKSDGYYAVDVNIRQLRYSCDEKILKDRVLNYVHIRKDIRNVEFIFDYGTIEIDSYQDELHLKVINKKGIYENEQSISDYCEDRILSAIKNTIKDDKGIFHDLYTIKTESGGFTLDFYTDLSNHNTNKITYMIDHISDKENDDNIY